MPFWRRNNNNNLGGVSSTATYGNDDYEYMNGNGNGNLSGNQLGNNNGRWGNNGGQWGNNFNNNNSSSAYGNDFYDEGYGNQGYGNQGYGNQGYGNQGYGNQGQVYGNQYGNNNGPWGNNFNQNNSRHGRNSFATPFGTPGFASENLLADNPWTHNTLGYDYYDYYADQRVRGPFGVAPGSVVPPSQRHLFGRNRNANNNVNGGQKRGGFFHRNRANNTNTGPAVTGTGSSGATMSGLNRGVIPPGAAVATTNQPIVQQGQNEFYERTLPDGSVEQVEQETVQTTQQDVVSNARGINGGKWANRKGINPVGNSTGIANTLPTNVPSTASQTLSTEGYHSTIPIEQEFSQMNITPNTYNNSSSRFPVANETIVEKKIETIGTGSGLPVVANNVAPTRAI